MTTGSCERAVVRWLLMHSAFSLASVAWTALVAIRDVRGWLLLQERDEFAPADPCKWGLVGGGVEAGESFRAAARRELLEETGLDCSTLLGRGEFSLPCAVHGRDDVALFTAELDVTDADVSCMEGRQIVFVDPGSAGQLDLTDMTRALLGEVIPGY